MTSDVFVAFPGRKLTAAGVQKVFPTGEVLRQHARRLVEQQLTKEAFDTMREELAAKAAAHRLPRDLFSRVRKLLAERPRIAVGCCGRVGARSRLKAARVNRSDVGCRHFGSHITIEHQTISLIRSPPLQGVITPSNQANGPRAMRTLVPGSSRQGFLSSAVWQQQPRNPRMKLSAIAQGSPYSASGSSRVNRRVEIGEADQLLQIGSAQQSALHEIEMAARIGVSSALLTRLPTKCIANKFKTGS